MRWTRIVGAPGLIAGRVWNLVSDRQARQDERRLSVRQNHVVPTPVAGAKPAVASEARPGSGPLIRRRR